MNHRLLRSLAFLALCAASTGAFAECSVGAQGIAFGSYDPFVDQDADSVGNIAVNCDAGVVYTLALSSGAGTYAVRRMTGASHTLEYQLYIDAARLSPWGDGTGRTSTQTGVGTGNASNIAVYGRIPARQAAHVGSYLDSLVVTISF